MLSLVSYLITLDLDHFYTLRRKIVNVIEIFWEERRGRRQTPESPWPRFPTNDPFSPYYWVIRVLGTNVSGALLM